MESLADLSTQSHDSEAPRINTRGAALSTVVAWLHRAEHGPPPSIARLCPSPSISERKGPKDLSART